MAERFAEAGMSVVLADVEAEALDVAVDQMTAAGAAVVGVRTDVSELSDVEALFGVATEQFGSVHVVCNNAGVSGRIAEVSRLSIMDWQWTLGVNLWGVIHGCHVFLPHLLRQGEGHIVNTASMAGILTWPHLGPYNVSKHGVVALSETIHQELAVTGSAVGVSVLCPGGVSTRIMDSARNRPAALADGEDQGGRTARSEATVEGLSKAIDGGMSPSFVAGLVHDAVLANELYIIPLRDGPERIRSRHAAIEAAVRPPAD
jgi:NAD(P)-dependent dehydrogenase (short-subunit alcohol dehydrogenase family)